MYMMLNGKLTNCNSSTIIAHISQHVYTSIFVKMLMDIINSLNNDPNLNPQDKLS